MNKIPYYADGNLQLQLQQLSLAQPFTWTTANYTGASSCTVFQVGVAGALPPKISVNVSNVALAGNSQLMLSVAPSIAMTVNYGSAVVAYNLAISIGKSWH